MSITRDYMMDTSDEAIANLKSTSLLAFLHQVMFDKETRGKLALADNAGIIDLIHQYGFDVSNPSLASALEGANNAALRYVIALKEGNVDLAAEKDYQVCMGAIMAALYEEYMGPMFIPLW